MANDPVQGKYVRIYVDDGEGTPALVEHQEQTTFNTGRTQESVRTKTGTLTYQVENGETLTFTFRKLRPLSAGQNRLYAIHESNELTEITYDDERSGGHKIVGNGRVTITEETAGVDDIVAANVTIAFEGEITRKVNP